jgi:hypothetical protein
MSEPNRQVIRVGTDFEDEYPDGDTTCTEAYASLVRTDEALLASSTGASG